MAGDPDAGTGAAGDLVAERAELLELLARTQADHAAGELDDVDAEALIDDYTARIAELTRTIDPASAPRRRRPAATPATGPRRAALWWVVAVVVFALVAGLLVAQSAGRRGAGETFTGDIRQTTRDLLLEARDLTAAGEYDAALDTYAEVLAIAPTNAEALTYSAWVGRTMAGTLDDDAALALLDDATASDPGFADARVFSAIILRDQGRYDEAATQLEAVDDDAVPPFMVAQVAALRAEVSGAGPDRVEVVRAEAAVRRGDYTEAIRLLDGVLARSPADVGALIAKADVLLVVASNTSGDDRALLVGNAESLIDRAVAAAPDDPTPKLYRALVLELGGDTAAARAVLDTIEVGPGTDPALAAEVQALRDRLDRQR